MGQQPSPLDTRLASIGLIFGAVAIGYFYYSNRASASTAAPLPPDSLSDSGGGGFLSRAEGGTPPVLPPVTSATMGTIDFGAYKPVPLTGPGMGVGQIPTAQEFSDSINSAIRKAQGGP